MTEASQRALTGLRDLSSLQWYVIPLLAFVFYVYVIEIQSARRKKCWDAVIAGATLFGMDFFNETCNGWILHLTGRSALWTAPGPTAMRTMVGWNIEIMFMFAISGIIYYHSLSEAEPDGPLLRRKEAWILGAGYSAVCVAVELLLNKGGLLVWEYPFWNRSFFGVWPIFFLGYFHFYAAIILVLSFRRMRSRLIALAGIYAAPTAMNLLAMGCLGWVY
jgi:hypothetical protein